MLQHSTMKGMLALTTPQDLFSKLQHDLHRLEADPNDRYAAFDFFVTAYHLLGWLHPDSLPKDAVRDQAAAEAKATLMASQPLLFVAGHIANGSKHHTVHAAKWRHVAGFAARIPTFGNFLWVPRAWAQGAWADTRLVIELTGEAATLCGFRFIEARSAARKLLSFWEQELASSQ